MICTRCRIDFADAQTATIGSPWNEQPALRRRLNALGPGFKERSERALEILAEPLADEPTAVAHTPRDGEGYGLVEAPRGPLVHRYRIEAGRIAEAEFIIPTVHNVLAIERALRVAADRYVTPDSVRLELDRAVGRVVRAFDPCIACATH